MAGFLELRTRGSSAMNMLLVRTRIQEAKKDDRTGYYYTEI